MIAWRRWRGGRALIHAHEPGSDRSLCGRESVHGSIAAEPPSLQQRLHGDACHHCLDRSSQRAQEARIRGDAA